MMRCPFCHGGIEKLEDGVRCKRCHAPHHLGCWDEFGQKCSVYGCSSTEHVPLTKLGAARIVLAAGQKAVTRTLANARERLGGKSVVTLFLLSCFVPGLGLAPLLYGVHASRKVDIEVVFGSLFVILATWITALLYRGVTLQDDLQVKVGERDVKTYMFFTPGGSGGSSGGCSDVGGCIGGSGDLDGIIAGILVVVVAILVLLVVLPVIAWLAVEVLFPCIVIAVYGTLYGALAFAVNRQGALAGRFGAALFRGVVFALLYTGFVATLLGVGYKLFHLHAKLPL